MQKIHFFLKETIVFLDFWPCFAFALFFLAWYPKTFCHFSLFSMSLTNTLFLLSQSLCFCSKKKHLKKQIDPLYFYVYSPCCYSSYSPRFCFLFFFLLPCFLSLCLLSLCLSTLFLMFMLLSLSLFLMLLLFSSFLKKFTCPFVFLFEKKLLFSFVHRFLMKLFLFCLHCCFAFFVLFNRVHSNKINWPLLFGAEKPLV